MSNDSPITTEEKCRVIAEFVGFRFQSAKGNPDDDAFEPSQWHAPSCQCTSTTPGDKCTCVDLCYEWDEEKSPDFYQSEEASALILEKSPEPQLWLESDAGQPHKLWGYMADMNHTELCFHHADRKTAIAEAAYLYVIREAERVGSNQQAPVGGESNSSSSLSSEKKDIKETR